MMSVYQNVWEKHEILKFSEKLIEIIMSSFTIN